VVGPRRRGNLSHVAKGPRPMGASLLVAGGLERISGYYGAVAVAPLFSLKQRSIRCEGRRLNWSFAMQARLVMLSASKRALSASLAVRFFPRLPSFTLARRDSLRTADLASLDPNPPGIRQVRMTLRSQGFIHNSRLIRTIRSSAFNKEFFLFCADLGGTRVGGDHCLTVQRTATYLG